MPTPGRKIRGYVTNTWCHIGLLYTVWSFWRDTAVSFYTVFWIKGQPVAVAILLTQMLEKEMMGDIVQWLDTIDRWCVLQVEEAVSSFSNSFKRQSVLYTDHWALASLPSCTARIARNYILTAFDWFLSMFNISALHETIATQSVDMLLV